MCEPAIMTTLAVGQAASGYMAQKAAAKQQEKNQAIATQQERERAGRENTAIRARQSQQREALALEIEEGARRANQARATVSVASSEAGISGRAADLVAQDVEVQHARYNRSLARQRSENDFSSNMQIEEALMRNKFNFQRINKPIKQPNLFGAIMEGVAGVANVQTQTANYTKATGQAPKFGGWADKLYDSVGGMLSIQPNESQVDMIPQNNIVVPSPSIGSQPNWNNSVAASGSLLPPIN